MINMHFHLQVSEINALIAKRGLETGGEVQKYIDSEVLRLSEKYTPKLSSVLSNSGQSNTEVGSGEVRWSTPYARYQYCGKVMIGPAPKTVTDIPLEYHGGGDRKEKWFEAMKAAHREDILRGAAEKAGGRSG